MYDITSGYFFIELKVEFVISRGILNMSRARLAQHDCVQASGDRRRSPNVSSMLDHRLRRWASIKPTLGQLFVFAERRLSGVS